MILCMTETPLGTVPVLYTEQGVLTQTTSIQNLIASRHGENSRAYIANRAHEH